MSDPLRSPLSAFAFFSRAIDAMPGDEPLPDWLRGEMQTGVGSDRARHLAEIEEMRQLALTCTDPEQARMYATFADMEQVHHDAYYGTALGHA